MLRLLRKAARIVKKCSSSKIS